MREDMICNALVWLLAKIVDFISAGDELVLDNEGPSSPIGVSQHSLIERWSRLQLELDIWYAGLPETFKPCARVDPPRGTVAPFAEVWYNIPMCASAMQNYSFARILLLINKPHESTARRSTVTSRLDSYRAIAEDVRHHSHEICGIALSRPEGSVRVHSTQPLFVAGQCLTAESERKVILDLLTGVECDLGWATEYRVKQLLNEWKWPAS